MHKFNAFRVWFQRIGPVDPDSGKADLRVIKSSRFVGAGSVKINNNYVEKKTTKKNLMAFQLWIDYFARVVVPIVIISFNIYYWGKAFQQGGLEV